MIDKIDISEIETLREQFKIYLNDNYRYLKDKSVISSDAFYPYRHDIGMSFEEVFVDENSLRKARELLEIEFTKLSRKNPKSDSYVYMRAFEIFKEFLVSNYGSIYNNSEFARADHPAKIKHVKHPINTHKKKIARPDIPRPSSDEVAKYLLSWDKLENYALQESALNKLFSQIYPQNKDIDDVLIKVSALNDFYSTNIFYSFNVAKHIVALNIDDRLIAGDVTLVNDIARVKMDNGSERILYSFASKYCSHHKPLDYPIYDSYVDKLLCYFRDIYRFNDFSNSDLKGYVKFKNILLEFRSFFGLTAHNLKELDKYLWQLGKEKFLKKEHNN
ncbi:MAG: hypothetical protein ABRQ39_27730 [Candidatus Eremiobacterota bacterium]